MQCLIRVWVLLDSAGDYVADDDHYTTDGPGGDNLADKFITRFGSKPVAPTRVFEMRAPVEKPRVEVIPAEVK